MLVGIAMIKCQTGSAERLELCGNLGRQLLPRMPIAHENAAKSDQIRTECARFIHQIGNSGGRQYRSTFGNCKM